MLSLHPSYQGKCKLGVLNVESVRIGPGTAELADCVKEFCRRRNRFFTIERATEVPGVQDAREMFRRLNVDPNKTRPCSETFLRHVLRRGEFYQICNLVDLTNWSSAEIASPVCVYDRACIEGEISFEPGGEEGYESIRGKQIKVNGKPILADSMGPFGSPFGDSGRTQIRPETVEALVVWFRLFDYPDRALLADIETYKERLKSFEIATAGEAEIII